jgi:LmbE family N-acetylglucosaminyl deacetylase
MKKLLPVILLAFLMFGSFFIFHINALEATNFYQKKVLVISPHHDDEMLGCAGVIKRYVDSGADIRMLYVTNSDMTNQSKDRLQESIAALNLLGLSKNKIFYLSYGDGILINLFNLRNFPDQVISSKYYSQTLSYPDMGIYSYHCSKYGSETAFTRRNVLNDLSNLLLEFQPEEIYMPAQMEGHGDHSATALFTLEAILKVRQSISYQPTTLEYMIYSFDLNLGIWLPWLYCDATQPVTNEYFNVDQYTPYSWRERVSLPVCAAMTIPFTPVWDNGPVETILPTDNLKYHAIHQFNSQSGSYYFFERLIRTDEVFWKRKINSLSYNATVTASSENYAKNQLGRNVVDGAFIGEMSPPFTGRNSDFQASEWAAAGPLYGTWIQLSWRYPITANQLKLYDRPNLNDNILSGRLQFSDGTTQMVGRLNPNGSATTINFPLKTFHWVKFIMDGFEGANPGLSEFEVYNTMENIALKALVTASSQTATNQLSTKAIDGAVDGYPHNYSKEWATNGQRTGAWLQLDWPQDYVISKVIIHDRINLNDHATAEKLTFSDGSYLHVGSLPNDGAGLVVSLPSKRTKSLRLEITGFTGYNAGLAEMEVYGYPLELNNDYFNIAPLARVAASSEASRLTSAIMAVDEIRSGSPCDSTYEWATGSQLNGAWLQLNWERKYHIQRVILYDRPNLEDHILAGKLFFDDGSTLYVSGLPNDGTGYPVEIPGGKNIKSLKFEITSATGRSAGLSEIEVLGCPGAKLDIQRLGAVITSTAAKSGTVNHCFDGREETSYVSQDPGHLGVNQEPSFVQVTFPSPVSVSRIRTLIGNPGSSKIQHDWWLEAADTQGDFYTKTGSYLKVGDTRYNVSGYWDQISLNGASVAKKIWRFWVKKKAYDDYSTITELELWSE